MGKKGTNPNTKWLRQEFLNLRRELLEFRKESVDNDLEMLNHIGDINKDVANLKGKMKMLMWGVPIVIALIMGIIGTLVRVL